MIKRLDVTAYTKLGALKRQTQELQKYKEDLILSIEKRIEDLRREMRRERPSRLDLVEKPEDRLETAKDRVSGPNGWIKELGRYIRGLSRDHTPNTPFDDIPGTSRGDIRANVKIINNIIEEIENIRDSVKEIRHSHPFLKDEEELQGE